MKQIPKYGSYPDSDDSTTPIHRLPQRTTKVTEKLVLLPSGEDANNQARAAFPGIYTTEELQSEAERLAKQDRSNIPRVTSYCLAESFNFEQVVKYLETSHNIKAKKYDECLYFYYDVTTKERLFGNSNYPVGRKQSFRKFPGDQIDVGFLPKYSKYEGIPATVSCGEVFLFDVFKT